MNVIALRQKAQTPQEEREELLAVCEAAECDGMMLMLADIAYDPYEDWSEEDFAAMEADEESAETTAEIAEPAEDAVEPVTKTEEPSGS